MARRTTLAALAALALAAPGAAQAQSFGLGSLFSCDASGSANTTGAVVGGLVGALAGSQVSKENRALGAAIGAGLGAALGNNIGCRMDRKSQQDAQAAFERALETGRAQSWSDPATGASGRIEVLGPVNVSTGGSSMSTARWRYAEGVSPAARVSTQGGSFAAANRINMRAAPNANAPVIDRLQAGEQFQVAGAVADGWLAVTESGLIQGYVARSVVRQVGGTTMASNSGGECKRVRQTFTERGQPTYSETYNACRSAEVGWRLTTV
jgi:surface antigen